ncbi:MAG: TRAP transporter substrate-binding protein [Elusimicrobiota bacterium]|jgi:tripartite ATP-independent transporter DctP family solute receptor|nr:TRAP transporter substrate-binding protein [Elusimicrobiota bacterium]
MKSMKSWIVLSVALVFVAAVFVGCGSKKSDVYLVKMATPSNPEDNCVKAFDYFKKLVEERSKGKIKVEVYHSGQLGSHRDYMEGMKMGSIQAAEVNVAVLSSFDPKFMVFDLPYIAGSVDRLRAIMDSGQGQKFSDSLEARTGVKIIGWMIRSPRNMYNSLRPIRVANDFKGMKVRIMESPIMSRTFTLLGAVPVPLSANERYMALQTKVVDGAENSTSLIITQKEYEVTKYVSRTEHFVSPNIIGMDAKFFKALPADLQKIVLDAGDEAGRYESKLDIESEGAAIEELKGLKMLVNDVPDKSSFVEKVKPIYTEYRDQIGGDLIDFFVNFKK